jgi:integrase
MPSGGPGRGRSAAATGRVSRRREHTLLSVPVRMRNLQGLRPDRHLVRAPGRRGRGGGTARLVIPDGKTKDGEPLEFPLPPALLRLLDLYLGRHRHLLRGKDEGWLFPGEKGGPKHAVSLAGQIKRAVRHQAGLEVHPHLFRHIAAKLLL